MLIVQSRLIGAITGFVHPGLLLLLVHIAGYLTIVFLVLSPLKGVVFILVQRGLFGLYLGLSFAPNHKGMPMLSDEENTDFLRRHVLTSRNIRGGWLVDLALGGLNYQIEHHLFPSMPRPNLRRSQAMIRAHCQRHGVAYCETTLWRSYAQALTHLHQVGQPLRTARATWPECVTRGRPSRQRIPGRVAAVLARAFRMARAARRPVACPRPRWVLYLRSARRVQRCGLWFNWLVSHWRNIGTTVSAGASSPISVAHVQVLTFLLLR